MQTIYEYEIQIEGIVSVDWSDWFDSLSVQPTSDKNTILRGTLADQAALLGVLTKIHALNLKILSVTRIPSDAAAG